MRYGSVPSEREFVEQSCSCTLIGASIQMYKQKLSEELIWFQLPDMNFSIVTPQTSSSEQFQPTMDSLDLFHLLVSKVACCVLQRNVLK